MNTIKTGDSLDDAHVHDLFAAAALTGLLSGTAVGTSGRAPSFSDDNKDRLVEEAWTYADKMMSARAKRLQEIRELAKKMVSHA